MHACVLICECVRLLCCHASMCVHEGLQVTVLACPHFAYKLKKAKKRGPIYKFPPPPPPLSLSLSLSLSVRPAACLLPACLVPRLRFQNFLLQATFRAASILYVCVCVCVCV